MFILVFIITILILVLIHELGHFLAAKKFKIKVLEFGFGIPPKIFGKKIGETVFSLNWLPFGGFVRLLGEDEVDKQSLSSEDDKKLWNKHSFAVQSVNKRILVVVAGVGMNLFLAALLFYLVLFSQGFKAQLPLLVSHNFIGVSQQNEKLVLVSKVSDSSPADKIGLKVGDRILAINDQSLKDSQELIDLTKANVGKKITLTISDISKNNQRQVELTPRENPPLGEGPLGVALSGVEVANIEYKEGWQKLLAGPVHSLNITVYSVKIFSSMIATSFQKRDFTPISQSVAGPVGITAVVKEILSVSNPLIPYLDFMAMLSLNLAIVNILPFPGLDGGRFFFLLFEAVTKKRVHATVEKYIHAVGLAVLLALIFLVTVSDIKKLIF
ncbi:site-2 protease family protein [Candidatus Daviesbacteria bacterium]|nr:site-2 protease family protein [Candidatus Daviesbacteria bacterium]